MSARVTRKRARLETEQEVGQEAGSCGGAAAPGGNSADVDDWEARGLRRDEDFWFEDGTIVIGARDVAFKVYARPLVDHSPVFKTMISLPQPDASDASLALATQFVQLSDPPEELRHAFEVLMPSKTLRPFGFQKIPYHMIAAWIRIGHKYEIDHLVQQSLDYLRTLYPKDYDAFHKRRADALLPVECSIGVVNLARLTGAVDLLPVALLDCCSLDARVVWGFAREDGTMERLSDDDLGLCIEANSRLIQARVQAAYSALSTFDVDVCLLGYSSRCEEDMQGFLASLLNGTMPGLFLPLPFTAFSGEIITERMPNICKACKLYLRTKWRAERRAIFERLPAILGIDVPGWGNKAG